MTAKKIDANQPSIVKALRDAGCSVQILSAVGKGCPDLLVSYHGLLFVVEVKDGGKFPSKRKLTPDEAEWHNKWIDAPVFLLDKVEDIVRLFGVVERHYLAAVRYFE